MIDHPTREVQEPEGCVLEEDERLSRSILWRQQRAFFASRGVEAWSDGIVPHSITCNPYIARAQARVVLGWLQDLARAPGGLDPSEPVYIVELGAGSGRFGHHFLRELFELRRGCTLPDVTITYVMTDYAESTLEALRVHPMLASLAESGALDFARFEAGHDREIRLRRSGTILAPGAVANPIAVVANYFFDSVPTDAFAVHDGQLHENLVTVGSPQPEPDPDDPSLLGRASISFAARAISGPYYDDPALDSLLAEYQERLAGTSFLFPVCALECVRDLHDLAGGRLLLVAADKGHVREVDLLDQGDPAIVVHGSLSMMVNFHALGRYVERRGGRSLVAAPRASLNIVALLTGEPPGGAVATAAAFAEAIERANPCDFFAVKNALRRTGYASFTLDEILGFVRLSGWDSGVLLDAFTAVIEKLPDASETLREQLHAAIQRTWEAYYPIGERRDLAFFLGALLYALACFSEALEFFQRSLVQHGPDARTHYHMALCHHRLRRREPALEQLDRSLALQPTDPARALRLKLAAGH